MSTRSQNMVLVPENAGGLRPARAAALWDAGGSGRGECSPCLSSLEESNYVSIDFKARNSNSPANTRSQTLSQLSPGRNLFTSGLNEHLAPIPPPPPLPWALSLGEWGRGRCQVSTTPYPRGLRADPGGAEPCPRPSRRAGSHEPAVTRPSARLRAVKGPPAGGSASGPAANALAGPGGRAPIGPQRGEGGRRNHA